MYVGEYVEKKNYKSNFEEGKKKRGAEKFQEHKLRQFAACDAMLNYIERQLLK